MTTPNEPVAISVVELSAHSTATPRDVPGIGDEMDRIRRDVAADLETENSALSGLSRRNRQLAEPTLAELREIRDKATAPR